VNKKKKNDKVKNPFDDEEEEKEQAQEQTKSTLNRSLNPFEDQPLSNAPGSLSRSTSLHAIGSRPPSPTSSFGKNPFSTHSTSPSPSSLPASSVVVPMSSLKCKSKSLKEPKKTRFALDYQPSRGKNKGENGNNSDEGSSINDDYQVEKSAKGMNANQRMIKVKSALKFQKEQENGDSESFQERMDANFGKVPKKEENRKRPNSMLAKMGSLPLILGEKKEKEKEEEDGQRRKVNRSKSLGTLGIEIPSDLTPEEATKASIAALKFQKFLKETENIDIYEGSSYDYYEEHGPSGAISHDSYDSSSTPDSPINQNHPTNHNNLNNQNLNQNKNNQKNQNSNYNPFDEPEIHFQNNKNNNNNNNKNNRNKNNNYYENNESESKNEEEEEKEPELVEIDFSTDEAQGANEKKKSLFNIFGFN